MSVAETPVALHCNQLPRLLHVSQYRLLNATVLATQYSIHLGSMADMHHTAHPDEDACWLVAHWYQQGTGQRQNNTPILGESHLNNTFQENDDIWQEAVDVCLGVPLAQRTKMGLNVHIFQNPAAT